MFFLVVGLIFLLLFKFSNLWLDAGDCDYCIEPLLLPLRLLNFISASDYVSYRSVWSFWGLFSSFVRVSRVAFTGTILALLLGVTLLGSLLSPLIVHWSLPTLAVQMLKSPRFAYSLPSLVEFYPMLWNVIFSQRLQILSMQVSGALFLYSFLLCWTLPCKFQLPQLSQILIAVSSAYLDCCAAI